jgi:uncharacterized protein YggE
VKEGYYASTDISFKFKDFDKYKSLWIGLSKIAHLEVWGVYYDHSKRIEYQNKTRKKALLAAKEKAEVLAKTLGSEIGEPLLIEEDLSISETWRSRSALSNVLEVADKGSSGGDVLSPGKIPIKIRVKTTFRLITHEK